MSAPPPSANPNTPHAGGPALAHRALRDRLAAFPAVVRATAACVAPTDVRWKPSPTDWSVLEVCWHLADEEREDFRPRAERTLRDPTEPWPPLDLEGVAEKRGYNQRDLAEALRQFTDARAANIAWLDSLPASTDWSRAFVHPKFGPLAAGMLLASWAAHDALHLRQLAKRLHGLAARDAGPYEIRYAGDW